MDPAINERFAAGELIVLLDDGAAPRPPLLLARAASVEPAGIAELVRYTSGFVTVALPAVRCDVLGLPALAHDPFGRVRPVAAVAADARVGVSTGISATDRCTTARVLADPSSGPSDLCRPGHVVPLRMPADTTRGADPAGGQLLAAMDLCASVGGLPAVVSSVLLGDSGDVLSQDAAARLAAVRGYPLLRAADIPVARGLVPVAGIAS